MEKLHRGYPTLLASGMLEELGHRPRMHLQNFLNVEPLSRSLVISGEPFMREALAFGQVYFRLS